MTTQTTTQTQIKAILVTRHKLLPAQEVALQKAGIEIVEVVPQVPSEVSELEKWCREKKAQGVEAIVTVALPPHLIAVIQKHLRVLVFKMKTIATTESEEEAMKLVQEKPTHRTALAGAIGEKKTWRVVEFEGLVEIKVQIEEKPIVSA